MRSASPVRTFLMLAAVFGMIGAAAATTSVTISAGPDGVKVHAETDDVPKLPPQGDDDKQPPRATFALNVSPPYQEAAPGATVRYVVEVRAARDVVVDLRVANVTRGFTAQLEASTVALRANTSAHVALDVRAPELRNGTSDKGMIVVEGAARDTRETHDATAYVRVVAPAPAKLSAWLDPAQRNGTHGDTLSFKLLINASHERDVVISSANSTPGYDVQHTPSVVRVQPGRLAVVNVTVHVLPNATHDGWFTLRVETREMDAKAFAVGQVRLHDASTTNTWTTSREAPTTEPGENVEEPSRAERVTPGPAPVTHEAEPTPAATGVRAGTAAGSFEVAVQPAMRIP